MTASGKYTTKVSRSRRLLAVEVMKISEKAVLGSMFSNTLIAKCSLKSVEKYQELKCFRFYQKRCN